MPTSTILSDNGVSSGTTGLKTAGGDDGTLVLQTTTAGGTATTAMTINTSQAVTFAQTANLPNTFGFKNRIINGDMRIDQRNDGASVTIGSSGTYTLDRWRFYTGNASKISVQRSTTAPTGFVNSLLVTSLAATSITTTDEYLMQHRIEGNNIADLAWGTASAKTVTLSFWVRSSLTGTFGGVLRNSNNDRCYPFTYTISSANTYEYKTITVAGDTSGTWETGTGVGINVFFGLGVGSTYSGTAGSWSSNYYSSATGAVSLVGTNGATLYITGVQLEVGSTATSFDYRDYGRELIMCERYFQVINSAIAIATGTTDVRCSFNFRTYMRTQPTVSETGVYNANYPGVGSITQSSVSVGVETGDDAAYGLLADFGNFTGLTAQRVYMFRPNVDGNRITFSAEL